MTTHNRKQIADELERIKKNRGHLAACPSRLGGYCECGFEENLDAAVAALREEGGRSSGAMRWAERLGRFCDENAPSVVTLTKADVMSIVAALRSQAAVPAKTDDTCKRCQGTGEVQYIDDPSIEDCPDCGGKGFVEVAAQPVEAPAKTDEPTSEQERLITEHLREAVRYWTRFENWTTTLYHVKKAHDLLQTRPKCGHCRGSGRVRLYACDPETSPCDDCNGTGAAQPVDSAKQDIGLWTCGIHNEDYVGSLGDCPKCKPVDSEPGDRDRFYVCECGASSARDCTCTEGGEPSESDVDGLAKLMRALAGDEYNSRIDPVTWQQPDYDGAARNFLARLSERRQGVTLEQVEKAMRQELNEWADPEAKNIVHRANADILSRLLAVQRHSIEQVSE